MLLIDMSMLVRRCFAKMDFLKTEDGVPTGIEYGSLRSLQMLQGKYPDQDVMLCYDSPKSFRKEKNPMYKAGRIRPSADFYERVNVFKKFLNCFYDSVEAEGYEADDLMYTLASLYRGPHLIYTNDDDLLQAVNDDADIKVLKSFQSNLYVWDEAKVIEKYGVSPMRLPELRAFTGDGSDGLVGVPRISKKLVAALIDWARTAGLTTPEMLNEIKTADWSDATREVIATFVDNGEWYKNYALMKLQVISYKTDFKKMDEQYAVEMLMKWQIRTLKICKQFRSVYEEQLAGEEF